MRIISEGQAIELLKTQFDLDAPVAFEDVKKKYRQESKKLHPDAGGSEEAFKALGNSFDELKKLYQMDSPLFDAEPFDNVAEGEPKPPSMPRTTVDGTPLSGLGLGLGPTTNGRDCPDCEHRGYTITKEHGRGRCEKCAGKRWQPREYDCRACWGTGKFTQRKSQRVVDCRVCEGKGKFQHPFQQEVCTACDGTGKTATDRVVNIYAVKCYTCKGTGETPVWNPVIPKGRIGLARTSSQQPTVVKTPPEVSAKSPKKKSAHRPDLMQDLLNELRAKGVGGKR